MDPLFYDMVVLGVSLVYLVASTVFHATTTTADRIVDPVIPEFLLG